MKKIHIILSVCFLLSLQLGVYAQNAFQYQAALRNNAGVPIGGQNVNVKFTILKESATGVAVYSETHTAQTNVKGLVNLMIGEGVASLNTFKDINWQAAEMFVKTEIDKGEGYTLASVQQLQTVPYSLFAVKSGGLQKKSADGTLWGLAVDNTGSLSTYKVEDTIIPIPAGYSKLVFNDEFNGTGLPDTSKWKFEEGYIRNGEKQYYAANRLENSYMQDGILHLVARNDSAVINGVKHPVTSASLHTRDIGHWLYCKVEIRAQLPASRGTWGGLWMMPQDDFYGGWPRSGELDIMEHVGYDPNYIHFSLHSQKYNGITNTHKYRAIFAPTTYTEFHTYGIEWHEDRIEWYFDGVKRFTVKDSEQVWSAWPFNKSFYLIVNMAFGGGWGGREGIDLASLPQDLKIDYIRVYQ